MQVAPIRGRTFSPDEAKAGAAPVAVIGYQLWQRLLGGRADVLSTPILIEGMPVPIVGVMPEGFTFPDETSIWGSVEREGWDRFGDSTAHNFEVIARLKPGVTPAVSEQDLNAIIRGLSERDRVLARENPTSQVVPLRTDLLGPQASVVMIGLGAVACVLLIACVNVVNLMLARSVAAESETGIRLALGAGRLAVARAVIAEGLTLSIAGAVVGLPLSVWAARLLATIAPASVTNGAGLSIDWRVAVLATAVTTIVGLACAWMPALRMSRVDVRHVLSASGRSLLAPPLRAMRALVAVEAALAVILLFGAGLLAKTLANLDRVDLGFRTSGVTMASASLGFLPESKYSKAEVRRDYFTDLSREASAIPGVTSVGLTAIPPLGFSPNGQFEVRGAAHRLNGMHFRLVGGDYFSALQIPVMRGRAFSSEDNASHPRVAVINQALAKAVFGGDDPLGKAIRMPGMDGGDDEFSTIVGIVADIHDRGQRRAADPEAYFSYLQRPQRTWSMTMVVTGSMPEATLVAALRERARRVDATVPLSFSSMATRAQALLETSQFRARLLGVLGIVALVLAAVGLVGVASYGVARRRAEIGLRMALGASPRKIQQLFLRTGVLPIAAGGIAGATAALFLSRTLTEFLFDVNPRDASTLAATCGVLLVCGLIANWWPARRAARVDPMTAMR
jgi:predicted permease